MTVMLRTDRCSASSPVMLNQGAALQRTGALAQHPQCDLFYCDHRG